MAPFKTFSFAAIILILLLALSTIYTVREGQDGLLLRLGKIVENPETGKADVKTPGIHFKWPIVNSVRLFDTRLQTLDIKSSRIVTEEKKDVLVDYFVKWRIKDLAMYFTRTSGYESRAQALLEQKVNDGLRAEFGKRNISEVVSGERSDIMAILQKQANESAGSLGIEVVDVRIKRIDLPTEVSNAVFDRMRAEREQIANEHRAEGRAKAEALRAAADADVTVTLATAESQAKKIRGDGDARAAKIYADAYNKDVSFYAFYRSLLAYQQSFNKKSDIMVLHPDSDFFRYFNQPKAKS